MKDSRQKSGALVVKGHMDTNDLPQTGFLRLPQVLALIPVSKTTWWAGIKAGRYPAGVKISSRVTAWRIKDLAPFLNHGLANQQGRD